MTLFSATSIEVLWPALLAGVLVLATHIPLGQEVLKRGIIFFDLAIAQTAALGMLAFTVWDPFHAADADSILGMILRNGAAFALALAVAVLFYRLRHLAVFMQEAFIGIAFVLTATGALLLLAADPNAGERMRSLLIGDILWIDPRDLVVLAFVYALALLAFYRFRRTHDWVFYPVFALVVALSTQWIGVYLVFASLIIPALAVWNQKHATARAFALGMAGYLLGLLGSVLWDMPAGAAVVWGLALVALVYFALNAYFFSKH